MKFKFLESTNKEKLASDCEAYCKASEIGTKNKLVKIYNHSVTNGEVVLNKVMIVYESTEET